jgi:hypothetical protein
MTEAEPSDAKPRPISTQALLRTAFPSAIPDDDGVPATGNNTRTRRGFTVIPQGQEPRWVIVGSPRRSLPVLGSWRPFKLKSRLQWQAILAAARFGILSRLPGVEEAETEIDAQYWAHRLGFADDWHIVLHLGNPSYTRKVIAFFLDQRSEVRAVAKLPLTEAAAAAILNEATILEHLQAKSPVPRVLFSDRDRGIAAQSFLHGAPTSRSLTAKHIDLLASLAEPNATVRLSDFHDSFATWIARLALPLPHASLARALAFLEDTTELPAFVEHRDFAPWNVKRLPDGALTLIDWEWAVRGSLPWQDICRFFYMQDQLFHGPGEVWSTLTTHPLLEGYLRRFAIPRAVLPGLTIHYLLRNLCLDWSNCERDTAPYLVSQLEQVLSAS